MASMYSRLEMAVSNANADERGVHRDRGNAISALQEAVIRSMCDRNDVAWGDPLLTSIHGTSEVEVARVFEAYAMLMRSGLSEFALGRRTL